MPKAQGSITVRRRPKDGTPGADAVRYWLVTSVSSVSMTAPSAGDATPVPSVITLGVKKQIGGSEPVDVAIVNSVNEEEGLKVNYAFTRNSTIEETKPLPILPVILNLPTSTEYKNVRINLYKGDKVIETVTIPFVSDGEPGKDGEDGLQGCIYRVTQWQEGKEYRNDTALTSTGLRYIDIALIPNPALATKADAYMCKKTHSPSSSSNAPGSDASSTYWSTLNSFAPILTPFLLADGAAITLLQSNQVIVLKEDTGTVNVALGGGKYPLWIGHSDPTKANFHVDDSGKAYMTDAEVAGKIVAGVAGGQRVELQPENKAMKIYDADGEEACSFEGNSYTRLTDLFSSVSGGLSIRSRTLTEYGFPGGTTLGKGSWSISGNEQAPNTFREDIVLSDTVHSSTPIEISVSGHLKTSYTLGDDYAQIDPVDSAGSDGPTLTKPVKPVMMKNASARLILCVDTYSDAALTQQVGSVTLASCYRNGAGNTFSNAKGKTTTGGYHVLKLRVMMSASGGGMSASVEWGSAVPGKSDISGSYASDFYVSRYFPNGFCLGMSAANYIWAYNQGTAGMRFVMENNGYGVDVSNYGIRIRHHNGSWTDMPLFVFKARCHCSNDGKTYYLSGTKSFDGYSPSASRIGKGHIRLTFPDSWKSALNLSEDTLMVNVVGYGTTNDGSNPNKAQIREITGSYLDVVLSDDATPNDGNFLIKIEIV